LIALL
jgi:helicase SWR1